MISRRALLSAANALGTVSPSRFGLRGDGTDETEKLQALADHLGANGGTCIFPPSQIYLHSKGVVFSGQGYTIDGNGCVLKMMNGVTADSRHFGIKLKGSHFKILNLVVDGNRQNRKPDESPCHNFYLEGATNGYFANCRSINAVCDGWIIWETNPKDPVTWCRGIDIFRCSATNSFRNGLSIINGYDILIAGGRYDHSNGTPPQAGIDLEADPGGPSPSMERVRLVGVSAQGNLGYGFQVSQVGRPRAVSWEHLIADGAGAGHKAVGFYLASPISSKDLHAMNFPDQRRFRRRP